MGKVNNSLTIDQIIFNDQGLSIEEQQKLIDKRHEEMSEAISEHQKLEEDDLVHELEKQLDNKDIPGATRAAIDFLTKVYGSELLGIWGLRYYKNMTSGDITPFDKASTKLLKMRGDIE